MGSLKQTVIDAISKMPDTAWTYTSKLDLLKIYDYIARDSAFYAKKLLMTLLINRTI